MNRRATRAVIAGMSTIGLLGALCSSAAMAASTPGSLDPTFGKGGKVITNLSGVPTSSVQQPNGDILVSITNFVTPTTAVARFLPNGGLDTSFGTGGVAETAIAGGKLTLEASGKIIVGGSNGSSTSTELAFAAERLNPNGQPDPTFGTGGVASASSEGFSPDCTLVEPSGKVLIGGYDDVTGRPPQVLGLIMRFNSNGTLDTSFGNSGRVHLPASGGGVADLGLDASGDVFVLTGGNDAVSELSSTGQLDASVTPATLASISKGNFGAFEGEGTTLLANDESLQSRAFTTANHGNYKAQILRHTVTGALDPAFSNPPFRYTGESTNLGRDVAREVVVGPEGKLIVVGNHSPSPFTTGVIGVERLNANGELDSTFGNGGGVTTAFSEHDGGYSVVVEPNGKIVVVGLSQIGEADHVVLARYLG
jgi:uncharacterized delta-60 repeat protein